MEGFFSDLLYRFLFLLIVVYALAMIICKGRGVTWVTTRIVLPILAAPFKLIASLANSTANTIHPKKKKKKDDH